MNMGGFRITKVNSSWSHEKCGFHHSLTWWSAPVISVISSWYEDRPSVPVMVPASGGWPWLSSRRCNSGEANFSARGIGGVSPRNMGNFWMGFLWKTGEVPWVLPFLPRHMGMFDGISRKFHNFFYGFCAKHGDWMNCMLILKPNNHGNWI